jgi:hypothetical protein
MTINRSALLMLALLCLALTSTYAAPLGTAFTYSGRLKYQNQPANGNFDLQVKLFDALNGPNQVGQTLTINGLSIVNGLFVTSLDFGGGPFNGTAYWLDIAARPSGNGQFTPLSPRQPVNPAPYALYSPSAGTANTTGANSVSGGSIQNSAVTGAKIAAGQVVKSLNGLTDNVSLQAGANVSLTPNGNTLTIAAGGSNPWSLTGNAGTTPGPNFIGTTDNQPLEVRVNNARALRLEPGFRFFGPSGPNLIGGFSGNRVSNGAVGATIAGGGYFDVIGGDVWNEISANLGVVGGGAFNDVRGVYGTVPGGLDNDANGYASFAAGQAARANHDGSFVWNSYNRPGNSFSPNRFHIFAQSGFSVDYDVQRPDGGGSHWAGIGVFPGQTITTWTGAHLDDTGDWWCRYIVAYGEGNEQAYLGGDGVGSDVQIGSLNPTVQNIAAYNPNTGYMNMIVKTLTILGGADLAEPFAMSHQNIPKGSVVIIDDQHAGQLKISTEPYDTRVAGIVSGAGGVNPGLSLQQQGVLESGQNVALSGRVYVLADATEHPIKPGDLLTTSATPGHAMKVADPARGQGAILGKAMSPLKQGRDLVLVLVTLQ